MNAITKIVFVLVLWLVMGLGYLSAATDLRRQGKRWSETLYSVEGVLFILSVVIPLVLMILWSLGD